MLKVVHALVDEDEEHTVMPEWYCMEGLGVAIRKHLTLPEQETGDADYKTIVTRGIGSLMLKTRELMESYMADPVANWELHALPQLNALRAFGVAVLLGTHTVIYDEKSLIDCVWEQAADS